MRLMIRLSEVKTCLALIRFTYGSLFLCMWCPFLFNNMEYIWRLGCDMRTCHIFSSSLNWIATSPTWSSCQLTSSATFYHQTSVFRNQNVLVTLKQKLVRLYHYICSQRDKKSMYLQKMELSKRILRRCIVVFENLNLCS